MLAAKTIGPAADHPCWELVDLDGKPDEAYEDTGAAHYATADAAWKAYKGRCGGDRDADDAPPPVLLPQVLDFRCLTAVAVCGTVLVDREHEWIMHQPDRQVLFEEALSQGWALLEDGSMTCGPQPCEQCAAVLAGLPLELAPPVIPGQLRIDGTEVQPS